MDLVADPDRYPVAHHVDRYAARVLERRDQQHRASGFREVAAVDRGDDVAVLEPDAIEDRARSDRKDPEPGRLPILGMRHGADLREQLVRVLRRPIDLRAVDGELELAVRLNRSARGSRGPCHNPQQWQKLAPFRARQELQKLVVVSAPENDTVPADRSERPVLELVAQAVALLRPVDTVLDDRE